MSIAPHSLMAVVLAAGESKRLGTPKQVCEYAGVSLVERAVQAAQPVATAGVVVVTGAEAEATEAAVRRALRPQDRLLRNADWRDGMGSSLAFGVRAVEPEAPEGVLVMLCDQPLVTADDIAALVAEWHADPDRPLVAGFGEAIGPPAVFPPAWYPRLAALEGDAGARALLESGADFKVFSLPAAATDIDTSADLRRLGEYDKHTGS